MELLMLGIFSAGLLLCVMLDRSILLAMGLGYCLFMVYGLVKGHRLKSLLVFSLKGIKTVKNILLTFLLIGVITASWRACGSIAVIVYSASGLCSPELMLPLTFLLCCLVSVLTGTAFGSAATAGVICASMASGMGIPMLYTGGAVLSGVFFGDRCSPVSTSALLVSQLTGTELYDNIRSMIKTAAVPFLLCCGAYWLLGRGVGSGDGGSAALIFRQYYDLSPWTLLPVAVVLVFSLFRLNVKITLGASSLCALAVAVLVQGFDPVALPRLCIFGFEPENAQLAALMSGGGVVSMVRVFCIVCISSCYSGIFKGTGFLSGIQGLMEGLSNKLTPFGALIAVSAAASAIACNQTLAIMLTEQLCGSQIPDKRELAIGLENSAVVIAPMIPWSIAGGVPLASVGAGAGSIAFAFFLYLVPLWSLGMYLIKRKARRPTL